MSYPASPGFSRQMLVAADAASADRLVFLKQTYAHLLGAIVAFVGLQILLFSLPVADNLAVRMMTGYMPLVMLGLFMLFSHLARNWAMSATSVGTQYVGLGVYVVLEALITYPLIWYAARFGGKDVLPAATTMTLILFFGLSVTVFMTKKDFAFLGPALSIGFLALLGVGVCGFFFGFSLGIIGSVIGLALACGWVLYSTSAVIRDFRLGQHVAASLALFASIALVFWYVLRIVLYLTDRK